MQWSRERGRAAGKESQSLRVIRLFKGNSILEIVDSHAHLEFPQFDEDRDAMLERARAAGVSNVLAIGSGTGVNKLDAAIPFAEQHDWIYATVGIHPHDVNDVTEGTFEQLEQLAKH